MVEPIFDYQFRLILIGDSTVGKSSLLKYFTDGKFAEVCDGNQVSHCTVLAYQLTIFKSDCPAFRSNSWSRFFCTSD